MDYHLNRAAATTRELIARIDGVQLENGNQVLEDIRSNLQALRHRATALLGSIDPSAEEVDDADLMA